MVITLVQIVLREYREASTVGTPPPDGCLCHGLLRLAVGAEPARAEGYALALRTSEEWVG